MGLEVFGSVARWRKRVSPSSAYTYERRLAEWLGWLEGRGGPLAGLSPDELVEFQERNRDYQILDAIQDYLLDKRGRAGYKRNLYATLRSFFLHNRVELPRDGGFRVTGDRPRVLGSLSVQEVRRILDSCNPCYRALFLCMLQGGMGSNELIYWSNNGWESLKEQLAMGANPIRVDLPGRKRARNIRPFYTFLGRNAIDALRAWIKVRPRGAEAIFVNQFREPVVKWSIRAYWLRHLKRLAIIEPDENPGPHTRYGKSPHELRDLFRSRWQKSGAAPEAAEFFMGHRIDPLEYNKAFMDQDYAEEQYIEAEPWLNIVSEDPERVSTRDVNKLKKMYERKLSDLKQELLTEVLKELDKVRKIEVS